MTQKRVIAALGLLAAVLITMPAAVHAAEPTFGQPTASAALGEPLTVTSTIDGTEGGTVELLVGLVGHEQKVVVPAHPGTVAGGWEASAEINVPAAVECACFADGESAPNSKIEYRFRVRAADGTAALGPVGQVTVTDDRFEWRTLEQDLVRVHWYEGDEAFAQSAADVSNQAIDGAAELLGATLPQPVDLFIYATQEALLEALSPNRESIAGEAHSTIGTMFVWIPPNQNPDQSGVIVAHELTHLVFNVNTDNLYHEPPRWLNEGVAVYLSEGYAANWVAVVNAAARNGSLIPLQGLAGFFPSPRDQFELAYGESVSAVDFFVRTHSEETLWDLVRSYAEGLSDDDAFSAATGGDMAAFNAAWMASLGAQVREPVGPQPAPPGPVPSAWNVENQPTAAPGATPVPFPSNAPRTLTPRPGEEVYGNDVGTVLGGVVVGVLVVLAMVALVLFIQRGRNRRPPSYY